jgi:hypothetical protein
MLHEGIVEAPARIFMSWLPFLCQDKPFGAQGKKP